MTNEELVALDNVEYDARLQRYSVRLEVDAEFMEALCGRGVECTHARLAPRGGQLILGFENALPTLQAWCGS